MFKKTYLASNITVPLKSFHMLSNLASDWKYYLMHQDK